MKHLLLKLRAASNKGLEYFKYNKNDPLEGVKMMEQFGVSHYLIVSESIDGYLNGERPTKRKFIIFILQLTLWMYAIKSLYFAYYNNRSLSIMIGDFIYLYPKPNILNLLLFIIFTAIAVVGKHSL